MGDRLKADKPSRCRTSHPGLLSLAMPPWVGAMSTSESWAVNEHACDALARIRGFAVLAGVWLRDS